jgi:hypothetical protein
MPDVTRLLEAAQAGDRVAAGQLLPLVYDELRKLATARMGCTGGLQINAKATISYLNTRCHIWKMTF